MVLPHKPRHYLLLSIVLFCAGLLFYSLFNEILLIRLPFKTSLNPLDQDQSQRKITKFFVWNGETYVTEEKEILYSDNTIRTLENIVSSWLTVLEEEKLMPKKVSLQSIMISSSGKEAYISFDRNPLTKDKSIYHKIKWIEGLLKTFKESKLSIESVHFLVHAKPLNDVHLDFNHSWPLHGYSQSL